MMKLELEQERKEWDRNAEFYFKELSCPFYKLLADEKLKMYLPEEEGKRILDLGAGMGFISDLLRKKKHYVISCDFSHLMSKLSKKKFHQLKYIVASADNLPFKNKQFDIVIADGLFHHLKYEGVLIEGIKEINRVLKDGGSLNIFDRHGALPSIALHWLIMKVKRLIEIFKGKFSSSSTSQEVAFTEKDLKLIEANHFSLLERKFVATIPFFILRVITNTIFYLFGEKYSFYLKKRLTKAAKFLEYRPKAKWMTVEQICKLKKTQ